MSLEKIDPEKNLLLKHPFTLMVSGSTSSGKSVFVRKLIESLPDLLIPIPSLPLRVLYAYGVWQDLYTYPLNNPFVRVKFVQGLPDVIDCDVLIVDDLMSKLSSSKKLSDIFTKHSHHKNVSVIFVVQNIFAQGKEMRNIALNCHYLSLHKNRRDLNQIRVLGHQLYGKGEFFFSSYKKAVLDREYGYLFCHLTATTKEENRLRTNILPQEFPVIIYRPLQENVSKHEALSPIINGHDKKEEKRPAFLH